MIALLQRVREASVRVEGEVVGSIGAGALVLLGVHRADSAAEADWLADKVAALRVFDDDDGRMNRSLVDAGGEALVVSQFTLYGDARRGNRPSYSDAAPPEIAEPLYEHFVRRLEVDLGRPVATGRFGAAMEVALVNDGPVTLWLQRRPDGKGG
jgi:D-tyrosyl-tRNA(Tyr) deacylase